MRPMANQPTRNAWIFGKYALLGLCSVLVIYGLINVTFHYTGTAELVPGAVHTACMIIYAFGYVCAVGRYGQMKRTQKE